MMASSVAGVRIREPELTAEIVSSAPDITAFEAVWNALFAARPCEPSTSFEWTQAMLRHHLTSDDRFRLLQVSARGQTRAVVPLVVRPTTLLGQSVAVLSPISEWYGTHGDLLCDALDEHMVAAILGILPALDVAWDTFRVSRLPAGRGVSELAARAATKAGYACSVRPARDYHVLDLPASFDDYLAGRTPKFQRYLRKVARDHEAAGRVRIERYATPDAFDEGYKALLQIERASWKQAEGTAITAVAHQGPFYRDMGRAAAQAGRAYLQVLWLNDEPIAHNLGYVLGGAFYYLKSSYDARFEGLSPSTLLRTHMMRELVERGTRTVDFLATYPWERQWTQTVAHQHSVIVYNRTPKGRVLRLLDSLKHRKGSGAEAADSDR
jgi:CelD/BcsL family acetyltransferase involved in cellulose biosynthesis